MLKIIPLFLLGLSLASCGGSKALTEQLVLFFEPAAVIPEKLKMPAQGYPFKIQVKDLELGRLYDNPGVIIRRTDYTIQFAKKGVWAVRPNVTASDLLLETLKQSIRCKALKERYSESSPDYIVSGSMDVVEEDLRNPKTRSSRLLLTLQITRTTDDQSLFEKTYTRSADIPDSEDFGPVAASLSASLADIFRLFVTDAVQVFNQEVSSYNAKNDGKD